MKENVKVSVIVPIFNTEKYLARCIESLLNQTLTDMEIILVDDISTDSSYEIAQKYAENFSKKIFLYKLPQKGRQGGARNLGMQVARGKYIGFVDSDDFVADTMYEKLYNLAEKFDADMTCCDMNEYYEKEVITKRTKCSIGKPEEMIQIDSNNRNVFLCEMRSFCLGIYKSEMINSNNVFFPENLAYEDNYFGIIAKYHTSRYVYTNDNLYYYNRENATSTTTIKNSMHHLDRIKTAQMALDYLKAQNDYRNIVLAAEYIYLEHFYIHTISCIVYFFDKVDYNLIRQVRDTFIKEFPNYKKNPFYITKFSKIKREIFAINEICPLLYVLIYKLFRKIVKK